MEAKVKKNPIRITIPKYGNALALLMEYASLYDSPILGKVEQLEKVFEIEIRVTCHKAQSIKRYINDNLIR